ncbi:uncharacterized protein, partial [Littorina saxatilis]|uniref:uncharacterized protein n=1 Tax=Littorina saxatilis TaxID=31220 RepID=UPI0038B689A7
IKETSVSSSVTVNSPHTKVGGFICSCSATWKVKPEYYNLSTAAVFRIEHPPQVELGIKNQTEGRDYLRTGDSLTCTVKAGKPPVESVRFYCLNPHLRDADDVISATSVSSSLDVYTSPDDIETLTRCFCKATLKIKSELYEFTSSSEYRFENVPSDIQLRVGPSDFVSNGLQAFTLTCNATDIYPPPTYIWSGVTCDKQIPENTCTFTPDPSDYDQKYVTCAASTSTGTTSKTLQLNFTYPPPQKPVIQSKRKLVKEIRIGDQLTCTVTGGKPLVDSVYFHCTNPDLPDKIDNVSDKFVTSSIIVTSAHLDSNTVMACACNATWQIKPEYYQQSTTAVLIIENISTSSPSENSQCDLVIQAHAAGRDFLTTGDTVTCTATGISSQVDSVHFYCINPDLPDGDDDINATSVSSSVTVPNVPESTENNMECFCNASWSPGLFDLNATATFHIQGETRYDTWTMISGVVGGSLAFLVIVIIVLVIIICRSRNSRAERESKNRVSLVNLEIPELPMQTVNAAVPGPKQGVSMSTLTDGTVYGFGCHNASSSTSRSKKYSDDPVFYSSVSLDDLGKASPTPRPRFHTLTRGQSGHDGEELYHALMHGKLPSVRADTNYSHADLTS